MKEFTVVYEENKILDELFHKLYDNYSQDIIEKNILELLVEVGELANETRCFKYWSNKKTSSKEIIMDEYADCFLMTLYFCNMVDIDMNEKFEKINEKNLVNQFKQLYKLVSQLDLDLDRDLIKNILSNLVNLGKLLDFTIKEIIDGSLLKISRNKSRFETGF